MRRFVAVGVVLMWWLAGVGVRAQQAEVLQVAGPLPSFEVATIKVYDPKNPSMFMVYPPGTKDISHIGGSARMLIAQAYQVSNMKERVLGLPEWGDKTIYRIEAKLPEGMFTQMQKMVQDDRQKQQSEMLQTLLAERFKLKMHIEKRELPAYDLVIAKGGAKLPPPEDPTPGEVDPTSPYPPKNMSSGMSYDPKGGRLRAINMPLAGLFMVPWMGLDGRFVVNKTGLTGKYTLRLELGPQETSMAAAGPDTGAGPANPSGNNETSVFSAVQEQLGLKLVPSKAMVEVVVIDHIEEPTEN